jgi:hypothetical protein
LVLPLPDEYRRAKVQADIVTYLQPIVVVPRRRPK